MFKKNAYLTKSIGRNLTLVQTLHFNSDARQIQEKEKENVYIVSRKRHTRKFVRMPKGGRGPLLGLYAITTVGFVDPPPSSLRFQKQRRRKKEGRCRSEGKKKAGFCWGVRGISCNSTGRAKRKTNQPRSKKRAARYIRLLVNSIESGQKGDGWNVAASSSRMLCYIQMISDTEELDWPSRIRNKFVVSLFFREEEKRKNIPIALSL